MNYDDLAAELRECVKGDVQTDAISRALYATDASIYQIEPLGVVLPKDEADVAAVVRLAHLRRLPIVARGGGTSLAGQAVGRAIHLDFTRYMNRLLEVNVAEQWAWVEPGIILDQLNADLAPHHLKFAPDVSPSNRATIGGMIANNSSGMYSLVYGKTIDHVLELKVVLADGSITTFCPLDEAELRARMANTELEGRVYRTVARLAREHADEIARRYPRVLRRVGGYNLDAFVPVVENGETRYGIMFGARSADRRFNMARMIVGSEGTLALALAARIQLVPRPKHTALAILEFDTLDAALDAVVPCLECQPAAVELMDDILLDLTRKSREYAQYLAMFVQGTPGALLQVEFFGESQEEVQDRLVHLEQHLRNQHHINCTVTPVIDARQKSAVLAVRKAGLPLLQSLSPDLKPETFVEDTAVPPEKLNTYLRRFRDICHAHGVRVAFYGHASVGVIHARPLLNLKNADDVRTMRAIAEQIKDLVIEFGGALSGEHGDGMLRAEFNRELFGETLYEAFREIKHTFDPYDIFNPGKIVDAPPMDRHLRYGAHYHPVRLHTHFRFSDTGGIVGAVELCNGNGLCRKLSGGTMCPSYMVTRDEEHSTRGRANALRMVFSGALPLDALTSTRMKEVMDLCLECKGCTGECPSRVNMTRLKSEWLSLYYEQHGMPLRSRLFGNIRTINEIGSRLAPLANRVLALPFLSALQERLIGVSRHRSLPPFASQPFHRWFASRQPPVDAGRPSVVLFPDTFADYNDPHIARSAVRVLEAAGYRVLLPTRRVCCGRPQISKGFLKEVKALAQRQLDALGPYAAAGIPIIGLEPSCILTFRDEYPDLLDDPRTATLAQMSFLFDEFLAREVRAGRATLRFRDQALRRYLFHGHCHQKALIGSTHALTLLRMIPAADVREVDSGCCGMAGSFGYEAEHYAISYKIGDRALFPAVRALPADAEIVAMGTSCRQQIADGTGRRARHLAEALADALEE
ncbi:FAD-binding and (Fe-S)-binding domain-containing protein [Roseiflexus sp.]|uniref:FAD-binding and (Fe-S)-binding domain-containing protein n=1 Tax=Roseiflexus sp. TaxID=2562120 RepID=UPI00398AA550